MASEQFLQDTFSCKGKRGWGSKVPNQWTLSCNAMGNRPEARHQLHIEASYGDDAAVERLLASGVAADAVDNEGLSLGTDLLTKN